MPLPSCVPPLLCQSPSPSTSPRPAYLPWHTLSPPAVPLSWKPASQLHCRVLSTCAQRGARLKAGSSAWRSGAAAGRRRVRAAPLSPDLLWERPGSPGGSLCRRRKREGGSPKPPRTACPGCAAHHPGQAEREGRGNRLFVPKGAAHTQCPQPAPQRASTSGGFFRAVFFFFSTVSMLCLFLNQEQK